MSAEKEGTMGSIGYLLMAIASAVMLVVVFIYNGLDRRRFHLERMFKRNKEQLDDWVRACEKLAPNCGEAYFAAKKLPEQMECLRKIVRQVRENSEEKLDIQEQLLDFCYHFSRMADEYDGKLQSPVTGGVARLLGFKAVGGLDFYPDVTA